MKMIGILLLASLSFGGIGFLAGLLWRTDLDAACERKKARQ